MGIFSGSQIIVSGNFDCISRLYRRKKACVVASSEVVLVVFYYGAGNIPGWKFTPCKRTYSLPWTMVAAQAVRGPGIAKVARSRLTKCSKSCDLQPALHCAIRGAQGVLPCVGWGVRPVNWIYRL